MQGFPAEFPILYTENGTTTGITVPYDGIAGYVGNMAQQKGITKIKIYGNSAYVNETVDNIKEFAMQEYANNNLEIEVISE